MPELYPITPYEKVIITARTLPSLLEGGTGTFCLPHQKDGGALCLQEDQPVAVACFLEKGLLQAIKIMPTRADSKVDAPPPGWRCLCLPPDQLLVPSFVDCHLHLALDGVEGFRSFTSPPSPQQLHSRLRALAAAGVLALRDGGDCYGSALAAQGMAHAVQGGSMGEKGPLPRIVATGPAIYRRGHYGAKLGGEGLTGLAGLEQEISGRKAAGAQQLKVVLSGLVNLQQPGKVGPLQFSLGEMGEIVRLAAAYELPVMVHASSDAAVRLATEAGVHSVEHGYFVEEETLKLMAEKGVAWVPTLAPLAALTELKNPLPADEGPHGTDAAAADTPAAAPQTAVLRRIVDGHLKMIGRAYELGVKIGVGTDGGAPGVSWTGGYWLELALLARAGLSPRELLLLATANGAALLGLSGERGLIAPGKPPCWLCLDARFLNGRIQKDTLRGVVFSQLQQR